MKYVLRVQEHCRSGEPVNVLFTLENSSADTLSVLRWYTPLEGIMGAIFTVVRDSTELAYEGRMVKRGDPGPDDYVRIAPGEAVSATVDLSTAYDLRAPGEYHVSFRGKIHDCHRGGGTLPRARDRQQSLEIQGNTAVFTVIRP